MIKGEKLTYTNGNGKKHKVVLAKDMDDEIIEIVIGYNHSNGRPITCWVNYDEIEIGW